MSAVKLERLIINLQGDSMKVLIELLKDLELAGFEKTVTSYGDIKLERVDARISMTVDNGDIEYCKGLDLANGLLNQMIVHSFNDKDVELEEKVLKIRQWVESMGIKLFEHEV